MTTNKSGGPAFPSESFKDIQTNRYVEARSGMTLRDYFIAHAPDEPQPWFKPKIEPAPQIPQSLKWCEGCKADSDCIGGADCDEIYRLRKLQHGWKEEKDKQRYIQWPAAWADAMMAERDKSE